NAHARGRGGKRGSALGAAGDCGALSNLPATNEGSWLLLHVAPGHSDRRRVPCGLGCIERRQGVQGEEARLPVGRASGAVDRAWITHSGSAHCGYFYRAKDGFAGRYGTSTPSISHGSTPRDRTKREDR